MARLEGLQGLAKPGRPGGSGRLGAAHRDLADALGVIRWHSPEGGKQSPEDRRLWGERAHGDLDLSLPQ